MEARRRKELRRFSGGWGLKDADLLLLRGSSCCEYSSDEGEGVEGELDEAGGDCGGVTLPRLWKGGTGEFFTTVATVVGEDREKETDSFLSRRVSACCDELGRPSSDESAGLDGRRSATVSTGVKLK